MRTFVCMADWTTSEGWNHYPHYLSSGNRGIQWNTHYCTAF